jgi:2-polyprenyl-6-methoxyphenol hydroxylase-like FAD-dependent oxidoreductase
MAHLDTDGTLFQYNGMTFHKHPSTYDAIISGAGPVGLFLACELALANCTVLILEKAESPNSPLKQLPFGLRGLSSPSVEALHRRGLLEDLEVPKRLQDPHSNAVQGPRRQMGHFAGIPFQAGHIDASQWKYRLPGAADAMLLSEMQELETVLSRRAVALGVDIKRGFPLTDFHSNDDGVTVAAGDESFSGCWLVGCDGSRSVVRKLGGFEFAGTEPEFTGYSAHVDIVDPEKLNPGRTLTPTGMYLQSQAGYLVLQDFDGGAFHGTGAPITIDHMQKVLRRISGTDVTLSALHIATTWTDRARQATTYRKGRVILLGDAAHIHAPLGGQGLNLGLGDAMNLGWKLAATIHQRAPKGLLDSYETERHPLGMQVLDWSRAQVLVMRPDPKARALNAILRDLIETRDGATYFAGRAWGVTTRYEFGGDHPLVGRSTPNFELTDGTTLGELMRDGKGMLLQFNEDESVKNLAIEYGDRINFVLCQAKESLGLSSVLIRPDGFVAWASDGEPDEASMRKALDRWFGAGAATP